jgi:hypothetical protein
MDTALRAATPANSNVESEPLDGWRDHCLQMAASTEALANWCEDAEMMNAYLDLARMWETKAAGQPAGRAALR